MEQLLSTGATGLGDVNSTARLVAGTSFVREIDSQGIGRLCVLSPFDHTD